MRDGTTVTAQRVGVDGTLIDATPFPLTATAGSAVEVAWASDRYVVTWNATTPLGDVDVYVIQVRPDGSTIEPAPVQLELPNDQFVDSMACNAAHCSIAYRDRVGSLYSMRVLRIARDLTLLDPAGIEVRASSASMRVGSTDAFHFVYWRESTALRGARISADGALLDPTPLALGSISYSGSSGAVVCLASGCMFGIETASGPTVLHVAPDGSFGSRLIGPRDNDAPALACGASSCRAAFSETTSSNRASTIEISPIGAPIGSAVQPVLRGNAQVGPTIVAGATELLVAWLDERVTPAQVRAVPMSTSGPLLPDSAVLNTLTSTAPTSIAGGFGGGTYFVSFAQSSQLRIRRVLADGSLPDSSTIDLGSVTGGARLAFDGRYFLVTWSSGGTLQGRRLNPIGATIEPAPFPINTGVGGDHATAWHGTGYVALWPEYRGSRDIDVYGRRIEPDGSLPDVFAFPVASADDRQDSVAMAYGGGQHLAVWVDRRHLPSGGGWAVYGTRVLPDGTALDPTGIAIRSGDPTSIVGPTVTWNGAEFIVAWLETTSIEDPPGSGTMRTARFYALARVAPDGALLDPTPVRAAEADLWSSSASPALASLPDGTTMLVYTRHDARPSIRVPRIFAREVTTIRVSGAACRGDADCASGICADGVCCDRACTDPCEACSLARGAATDGVCGPRLAGSVCRAAGGGICDVDEVCDGASTSCPPDLPDPACSGADAAVPGLDGGVPADASVPLDAGVDASASADAGARTDGGGEPRDAASPPGEDATTPEEDAGGGVVITEGCGCAVPPRGGSASALWLALALGWLTARRRRRGARGRRAGCGRAG
ncbi:MAG: hypothetical protein M5U28_28735 [Sandaracinaceae bacterium]|nr:hypothetical protein [Sandaracinaceae bacterium]